MQEVIRNEGMINTVLIWSGVVDQPIQIMFTDTAILFGMVYVYLPLMVLPLYASMEKLDFRLVEAGYDLYATRLKVLLAHHHPAGQAGHRSPARSSSSSPRSAPMSRRACSAAART
jgi:ABC-type spermidine/putrescine transport system permease subunit I